MITSAKKDATHNIVLCIQSDLMFEIISTFPNLVPSKMLHPNYLVDPYPYKLCRIDDNY